MYHLPQYWLPILLPLLFGIISIIFELLPSRPKERTLNRFILRSSMSTCFTAFAIDLWALTTAISLKPVTKAYSIEFITAWVIIFLALHMLIYAISLLITDTFESGSKLNCIWKIPLWLWAVILLIFALIPIIYERNLIWRVFYV